MRVTDIDLLTEVGILDDHKRKGQDTTKQHNKVVGLLKAYNHNLERDYHMSISKTRALAQWNHINKRKTT